MDRELFPLVQNIFDEQFFPRSLVLTCSHCTQVGYFHGKKRRDAALCAEIEGWRQCDGQLYCPECCKAYQEEMICSEAPYRMLTGFINRNNPWPSNVLYPLEVSS